MPLLGLMTFTRIAPTVMQINHVGVITIETLYPLGERRDKHVTGRAQTSAHLRSRRPLHLKSYLDSSYACLFGTSKGGELSSRRTDSLFLDSLLTLSSNH